MDRGELRLLAKYRLSHGALFPEGPEVYQAILALLDENEKLRAALRATQDPNTYMADTMPSGKTETDQ